MTDWAAKSVGLAWRAFDWQLLTYAALLGGMGLAMAYTNSVEDGKMPLDAGTTFTRGLMWAVIAIVAYLLATAFDYRWLRTLAWPIYGLQMGLLVHHPGHRRRRGRIGPMDQPGPGHVPVQ